MAPKRKSDNKANKIAGMSTTFGHCRADGLDPRPLFDLALPLTTIILEICSDSFCALDHTVGLLPSQDCRLLPNGALIHRASN